MRRLPIYILVDTSGKMQGERIELVNRKLNELISNLRKDPYTLEAAYIWVASYDMDMQIYIPLTIYSVDLPVFDSRPSATSMQRGVLFFLESIFEKTINKPTAEKKVIIHLCFIYSAAENLQIVNPRMMQWHKY